MHIPQRSLAALFAVAVALLWLGHEAPAQSKTEKRPLTHQDYELWRTIQQPQISPDGRWAAFTIVPQDGDSELVVKDIGSGNEFRQNRGKASGGAGLAKGAAPVEPSGGGNVGFTSDSKYVIFSIAPSKSLAGDEKKSPGDQPKNSVGIMEVATGKVKVIPNVSSWRVAEDAPGGVVYHKYPVAEAKKEADPAPKKAGEDDGDDFQQPGKKGGGGFKKGDQAAPKAPKMPSDLVLHVLANGVEITIPAVLDYTLTRDARVFVCSIAEKEGEEGVFAFTPSARNPKVLDKLKLVVGKAKYTHFTWSDDQRYLAFFGDQAASPKDAPALSLYLWDREAALPKGVPATTLPPAAVEVLTSKSTAGLKDGMILAERGNIRFSEDGTKIYVGVAAPTPPTPEKEPTKDAKDSKKDDKAVVELWHWKDEHIQPMQKARLAQEKNRTYTAIYNILQKRLLQLTDKTMPNIIFSRDGGLALGYDDTPYAAMTDYDASYSDYYLVNTFDGSRKPLLKKHHWGVTFSPSGRFALYYDGKNWNSVALPGGAVTNLTQKIPTKFFNEDWDQPSTPPAYGVIGWTPDEYNVLISDKHDIWEVGSQGGSFRCLTSGLGAKLKVQFRYLKLDPKEKTIDTNRVLMLRVEDLVSHDNGFATIDPRRLEEPKLLGKMHPVFFGNPMKAKNADMLLMTAQRFDAFPDLWVAKTSLNDIVQFSNVNPEQKSFLWGTSELVHYKNADGVSLSGTLIKPENFDAKKKYPMIVYIYEKLSQNVNHFVTPKAGTSINPTYYASNGYLVFMPDIVYTTGYPGQSALKCVLPGIQHVIDRGFVNESAIGIQGHSWGGYQIAYMVTQTGRFKAAAAGAPVSNMTSAYDGIRWGSGMPRQFQYEKTQSRIGGTLWEYPMRFVENSPVFMADRVKTPLMMLHNDQDDAVPWYQGIEYYLALRRLGKEVYLFNYPGEPHGLKKKANEKDYTTRMQEFFDHHLKGAPAPMWMQKGIPYEPRPGAAAAPAVGGDN